MRISDWSADVGSSDLGKRQLDVLDRRLADNEYVAGADYTVADMAIWPWYGLLAKGLAYDAGEFLQVQDYKPVQRWTDPVAARPAVKRGRVVNRLIGDPRPEERRVGKEGVRTVKRGGAPD